MVDDFNSSLVKRSLYFNKRINKLEKFRYKMFSMIFFCYLFSYLISLLKFIFFISKYKANGSLFLAISIFVLFISFLIFISSCMKLVVDVLRKYLIDSILKGKDYKEISLKSKIRNSLSIFKQPKFCLRLISTVRDFVVFLSLLVTEIFVLFSSVMPFEMFVCLFVFQIITFLITLSNFVFSWYRFYRFYRSEKTVYKDRAIRCKFYSLLEKNVYLIFSLYIFISSLLFFLSSMGHVNEINMVAFYIFKIVLLSVIIIYAAIMRFIVWPKVLKDIDNEWQSDIRALEYIDKIIDHIKSDSELEKEEILSLFSKLEEIIKEKLLVNSTEDVVLKSLDDISKLTNDEEIISISTKIKDVFISKKERFISNECNISVVE